jgi:polyadenylate-binding protein
MILMIRSSSSAGSIFVEGLHKSIDYKALRDFFGIFGKIRAVKVDASGRSVGRGFVHFEKEEDAKEAIAKANGILLKNIKISVIPLKRTRGEVS